MENYQWATRCTAVYALCSTEQPSHLPEMIFESKYSAANAMRFHLIWCINCMIKMAFPFAALLKWLQLSSLYQLRMSVQISSNVRAYKPNRWIIYYIWMDENRHFRISYLASISTHTSFQLYDSAINTFGRWKGKFEMCVHCVATNIFQANNLNLNKHTHKKRITIAVPRHNSDEEREEKKRHQSFIIQTQNGNRVSAISSFDAILCMHLVK